MQLMFTSVTLSRLNSINAIYVKRCWLNLECSNVPINQWSNVPMFHWFIGILVHWFISPLVHWSRESQREIQRAQRAIERESQTNRSAQIYLHRLHCVYQLGKAKPSDWNIFGILEWLPEVRTLLRGGKGLKVSWAFILAPLGGPLGAPVGGPFDGFDEDLKQHTKEFFIVARCHQFDQASIFGGLYHLRENKFEIKTKASKTYYIVNWHQRCM